jgi:hypothetical protein
MGFITPGPQFIGPGRRVVPVQISFPTAPSNEASIFARQLRNELCNAGVPTDAISITRTNAEYMDIGSLLQIAFDGIQGIAATHSCFKFAQLIYHFSRRNHCTVNIQSDIGNINIGTDKIDADGLASVLKTIAEVSRGKSG